MKIKHVFTTLGLAIAAIGIGAGLNAKGAVREAKAADGDPVDYYLVGHGTFASSDWSTSGGVRMVAHGDDKGAVYGQLLTAGDAFKARHATNDWWYSYGALRGSTSFFLEGVNNMISTPTSAAWGDNQTGYSQSNYGSVNGGSGDVRTDGKHDMYIKAAPWWYTNSFSYGGIHLWGSNIDGVENQDNVWLSGTKIAEVTEETTTYYIYKIENVPTTGVTGWEVYRNNGKSNDAKSSNQSFTGNGNIVAKTTGYYDLYLNSESQLYVFDSVQQWIDANMHMEDENYEGNGTGLCKSAGTYTAAKEALLALGEDVVEHFRTNAGSKYTDALARYNAWAEANTDATPFSNSGNGSNYKFSSVESSNMLIVVVSAIAVVSLTGLFLIKKKN